MNSEQLVFLIIGLVLVAVAAHFLFRSNNPENRWVKKRRKNYGKVITRAKRPVVMLNVKTDK